MSSMEPQVEVNEAMKKVVEKVGRLRFIARQTILDTHSNHRNNSKKYDDECPACVYLFFQLTRSPNATDQERGVEFFRKLIDKYEPGYISEMISTALLALGPPHRPTYASEVYEKLRTYEDDVLALFYVI